MEKNKFNPKNLIRFKSMVIRSNYGAAGIEDEILENQCLG
jgi:hypothetical protein